MNWVVGFDLILAYSNRSDKSPWKNKKKNSEIRTAFQSFFLYVSSILNTGESMTKSAIGYAQLYGPKKFVSMKISMSVYLERISE